MNYYYFTRRLYERYAKQFYCYTVYLVPAIAFFIFSWLLREDALSFFAIVFVWGWISWTFIEYIMHRFWMHDKPHVAGEKDFANHQYHHTHPTEIKIKPVHRLLMFCGVVLLIGAAILFQNYFTFISGFATGFVGYTFMHVVLHKKWSAKLFPKLQEFHVYHHCKYPNRCFGVTTILWDVVFNTTPPPNAKISNRIRDFYFGQEH